MTKVAVHGETSSLCEMNIVTDPINTRVLAMAAYHHRSRCRHKLIALVVLCAISWQWAFISPAERVHSKSSLPQASGAHAAALAMTSMLVSAPASAQAQVDVAGAVVAYGHYLGLILATACLIAERLTIKAAMSRQKEEQMQVVDAVYGLAGLLVLITGYLRATEYGKGWEFYQHEPVFWLKLTLVAVTAAASFFVTATIIRRAVAQSKAGDQPIAPVSEKLANRMTSVINAQLLAIGSIPLTATLMSRGVFYADWLPWQAAAFPPVLALFGLGVRYVKEAVEWTDDGV